MLRHADELYFGSLGESCTLNSCAIAAGLLILAAQTVTNNILRMEPPISYPDHPTAGLHKQVACRWFPRSPGQPSQRQSVFPEGNRFVGITIVKH
jgi:hypothetical protein